MSVDVSTYAKQVRQLVEHHKKLKRNGKLLFAGWYDRENDSGDVNLFEVYEDFPDPGIGKLETFLFPSTADFQIRGSLRLTVTSPSELRDAAARDDSTLASIMNSTNREVIHPRNGNWDREIERLGR
ncbi:MAG: hypothetical protein Q7T82_15590 [Armatimonadota bacterium]|nr:hypothetical protein [Armatimonadota bacterium]